MLISVESEQLQVKLRHPTLISMYRIWLIRRGPTTSVSRFGKEDMGYGRGLDLTRILVGTLTLLSLLKSSVLYTGVTL